jgi:hypothetical protein
LFLSLIIILQRTYDTASGPKKHQTYLYVLLHFY